MFFFFSGAYIKLRDRSWAPVVEQFLGQRLSNFICSNDDDAKLLNRMLVDVIPNGKRPQITTASMNGQVCDLKYKQPVFSIVITIY